MAFPALSLSEPPVEALDRVVRALEDASGEPRGRRRLSEFDDDEDHQGPYIRVEHRTSRVVRVDSLRPGWYHLDLFDAAISAKPNERGMWELRFVCQSTGMCPLGVPLSTLWSSCVFCIPYRDAPNQYTLFVARCVRSILERAFHVPVEMWYDRTDDRH